MISDYINLNEIIYFYDEINFQANYFKVEVFNLKFCKKHMLFYFKIFILADFICSFLFLLNDFVKSFTILVVQTL